MKKEKNILIGLLLCLLCGCNNANSLLISANNSSSNSSSSLENSSIDINSSINSSDITSSSSNIVISSSNSSEMISSSNSSISGPSSSISSNNSSSNIISSSSEILIDKGTLEIDIPSTIYSNYPAKDITYNFSKEEYASELRYLVSDSRLKIENGKIYAKGVFDQPFDVTVKVISEHHSPIVKKVNVSTYNGGINLETKLQHYEENIIKEENKGGTIFIGDSYFDGCPKTNPPFWKDFYTDYVNENKTFLMGISSSQIEQLEIMSERIVYPMEPKEIVMHIGFNDVHTGKLPVEEIYSRIVSLVNKFREKLPNVKIYYIGVEPKKNGYTSGTAHYVSSTVRAPLLTEKMKGFSAENEWFTYVDTMDIFVTNGVINTNAYLSSDLSHPTLTSYDKIREKINEARGVNNNVVDNSSFTITKYGNSESINTSGRQLSSSIGSDLKNNYIVKGKLNITSINKSNAHLQFRFSQSTRFLLWDNNSDGVLGVGYTSSSGNKSDKTSGAVLYDANNGLTLNWAIVVSNNRAYFVIENEVKEVLENPTLDYFNIGALQMNVEFTNIEVIEKTNNLLNYESLLSTYKIDS